MIIKFNMKFLEELKSIVDVKVTYIKKNQEVLNRDVFGRILYHHLSKKYAMCDSINYVCDELRDLKYSTTFHKGNASRQMKKLFDDWSKCKKFKAVDLKKMPKIFDKLNILMNKPFNFNEKKYKERVETNNNDQIYDFISDGIDAEVENYHDKPVIFDQKSTKQKKNLLTENLSSALDRTKISTRSAVFVIAATAEALGHSTDDIVLSRESIRIGRKRLREQTSNEIINSFTPNCTLTVHWDGKIVQDLRLPKKVERLAIFVTGNFLNYVQSRDNINISIFLNAA